MSRNRPVYPDGNRIARYFAIGQSIRARREAAGLTLRDLAAADAYAADAADARRVRFLAARDAINASAVDLIRRMCAAKDASHDRGEEGDTRR